MGALRLGFRSSPRVDGVAVDPEPDWSFDALISELNALESKLATTSLTTPTSQFKKTMPYSNRNDGDRGKPFVLRANDYEFDDSESEDENDKALLPVKRFNCNEIYLSDSDESEVVSAFEMQPYLMDEVEEVEGALFELANEHQLRVKDEIRSKISALETALANESQNVTSALRRVEKYKESRQELDKKFDTQYQRRIAEALDNHLTSVQREREHKSQIEERKIRSDAYEEAKRKAALEEEKQQQEKDKAEEEAKLRAEEAKLAALEAERKASIEAQRRAAMEAEKRAATEAERRAEKEARERDGTETAQRITSGVTQQEAAGRPTAEINESGNLYRAAASALNLERGRLQILKELCERNQVIRSSSNKDYTRHESHISRLIRQIRGVIDNVRSKSNDLIKLLNDPQCPQSISIEIFAKKIVSYCANPGNAAFASGYVIVLVTSKFPHAMDVLLAELHSACLYTVPKHLVYRKTTFQSKEAYFKSMHYREDDGKLESTEDYLKRLESYMKVYGALVQTEIPGVQNLHGLQEGWAWLARFLNNLPANHYTAVSLNAFLQMAGFALYRRYRSQFLKLLKVISENFLVDLKARQVPEMTRTVVEIQTYIDDRKFLQEPEGRSLQSHLLSSVLHY